MKDFCRIVEYKNGNKCYLNENDQYHRLTGPAIEWLDGNKWYHINDIHYMTFYKYSNELYIYPEIFKLITEYEIYIKQNIKNLIQEYNPEINLSYFFTKEVINNLPNWLKDLVTI